MITTDVFKPFVHSAAAAVQSVSGCGKLTYALVKTYSFLTLAVVSPKINFVVDKTTMADVGEYPVTVKVTSDRGFIQEYTAFVLIQDPCGATTLTIPKLADYLLFMNYP